jgi:hypothetical protein
MNKMEDKRITRQVFGEGSKPRGNRDLEMAIQRLEQAIDVTSEMSNSNLITYM